MVVIVFLCNFERLLFKILEKLQGTANLLIVFCHKQVTFKKSSSAQNHAAFLLKLMQLSCNRFHNRNHRGKITLESGLVVVAYLRTQILACEEISTLHTNGNGSPSLKKPVFGAGSRPWTAIRLRLCVEDESYLLQYIPLTTNSVGTSKGYFLVKKFLL